MQRRKVMGGFLTGVALVATGCSFTPQSEYVAQPGNWRGRISIHIDEDAAKPQSYIGSFWLRGSSQTGALEIYNPIGTTVAQLDWSGNRAQLNDGGRVHQSESLDELLAKVFGTPLPVQALFAWLSGESVQAAGWQVNLERYGRGRIDAVRLSPLPVARMRIILEAE